MNKYDDNLARLQNLINEKTSDTSKTLLEAGCGSASRLNLSVFDKIYGIDISSEQLEKNKIISVKILGDIQTYSFEGKMFDVIISWDVLEHLENPNQALDKFDIAIKDGGLIVVKAPEPKSLKGLVTKFTPFIFHKYYYKLILKTVITPFPTYLKNEMSKDRIIDYLRGRSYSVVMDETYPAYSSIEALKKKKILWIIYKFLSLPFPNKYQNSEYILVLKKEVKA